MLYAVTNMKHLEISEKVKDKICGFIYDKNIHDVLKPIPDKGYSKIECDYELAYHPDIDDKVFVISLVLEYYGFSLENKKNNLYAFDITNGQHIENFKPNAEPYGKFLRKLKIVEFIA
jgi:hypothetical protein